MAKQNDNVPQGGQISVDERFHYIGFEVFPGKPKDLFTSDAEKQKYIDAARAHREHGDTSRENCSLNEERISKADRNVLVAAAFALFLSLFMPWYSVFNEVVVEPTAGQASVSSAGTTSGGSTLSSSGAKEEVITSFKARKKTRRDYTTVSGIGGLLAIGSAGGVMFSSGFTLILTALALLALTLACIGLPVYTLYELFVIKGDADERAVAMKKILKYNWLVLICFSVALILSMFGADYSGSPQSTFSSLGASYSMATFFGAMSWGLLVAIGASIVLAVKSSEI
jgi:hypothetical protein